MTSIGNRPRMTKIVCTIGPASADERTLSGLCEAGMDVARLNLSHSDAREVKEVAARLRRCARDAGTTVAILLDLQGPKIRLGELDAPLRLQPGDEVILSPEDSARPGDVPITYADLARDISAGDRILMNDGQIELRATEIDAPRVTAEVLIGGEVGSGKGINLPGVRIGAPALTSKDLEDLLLLEEIEVEYVALSFVRSADNVRELRARLPEDVLIMAKIEKELAVQDLDPILDAADTVMVARGDLGSELPFEKVPLVQKRIVRSAVSRHRPVVIATEMLETMTERPRPTRAEVSDAANAILDGTDAVMLSAETAIGRYPVESVNALVRVIDEIETNSMLLTAEAVRDQSATTQGDGPPATEVAVARATLEAVRALRVPAIVTFTRSGFTARVVSSRRPPVPIVAVTDSERVRRQLALVWGVVPVLATGEATYERLWEKASAELVQRGIARAGDRIVVTAGMPFHVAGTTNMVRIEEL
jgi:pyruvate kinase